MIDFRQVGRRFGSQEILGSASFHISDRERVGIVGPNGAGKSTVFALICGDIDADAGNVELSRGSRIGHLRQEFNPKDVTASLLEYAESGHKDLLAIQTEMEALESELHHDRVPDRERALSKLGELQTRFEAGGGYHLRARTETTLCGLGFAEGDFGRPFNSFSGGWQMRAELARVLVTSPDVLLLDEPTNYLDIPAVEWLQKYLKAFSGTMLLISHDRYLLNSLTTVTIEIANTEATRYSGNYDYYVKERALRHDQRLAARKNQERERARAQRFIDRFRAKNTKASQVQSKIKMLERMEEITVSQQVTSPGRIRLKPPSRSGHEVVRLESAGLTYDKERWVLRKVDLSVQRGDKIALIGLNGMGKTTLLRVLSGHLLPSEGKRVPGHHVTVGYQSQEFAETMNANLTAFDTVKTAGQGVSDQEVRTLLGGFGFSGDAAEKPVDVLSGGEKVRLAFARLLVEPPNFLVLDEPTTHLDVTAREALERGLRDFEGTICMVSHDIEFVRRVATEIIAMRPPGIQCYSGSYDYYLEKTAEEMATRMPAGLGRKPRLSDRKARRRERAQLIQGLSRRKRHLKTHMSEAEKRIAELELEQTELLAGMERGGVDTDYATTNRRLNEIQIDLSQVTQLWEQTATELERLNAETNKGVGPSQVRSERTKQNNEL